jgi:hypothetical protein
VIRDRKDRLDQRDRLERQGLRELLDQQAQPELRVLRGFKDLQVWE